jgi:drug/metabolite transporter (DMT)-like permease
MRPRSIALMVGAGAAWGTAFLFVHAALKGFGPVQIGAFRNAIAAATVLAASPFLGGVDGGSARRLARRPLLALVAGAAGFSLPILLVSHGERSVPSGLTAVLVSTSPLIIAVVAPWFAPSERLGLRGLGGLVMGFAGVAVAVGIDSSLLSGDLGAIAALLLAATSSAFYPLIVHRWYEGVGPLAVTLHAALGGAVVLAPFLLLEGAPTPTAGSLAGLLALGVVATALPYLLFTTLVAEVGAGRASPTYFLIPVTGLLLGVLVLGEAITWTAPLGLALILFGVRTAGTATEAEPLPVTTSQPQPTPKGTHVRAAIPHPEEPRSAEHAS